MTEASEDHGVCLFVVRLELPTAAVVDSFDPPLRDQIRSNIDKAKRWFRGRTLPLPGSDGRLCAGSLTDWSGQINDLLLTGITDEVVRERISALPLDQPRRHGSRVYMTQNSDEPPPYWEMHYAGQVLGKYWYRHQEPTFWDAKKWIEEMKEAQAGGREAVLEPVPPTAPRR